MLGCRRGCDGWRVGVKDHEDQGQARLGLGVTLSMLELLVHVDKEDVSTGQRLLSFDIPDDANVNLATLPVGWDPLAYSATVCAIDDDWIAAASSLSLRAPRAVARHERNVLVNPAHPRIGDLLQVANEDLVLDLRLVA